jgi:hypothetical protein
MPAFVARHHADRDTFDRHYVQVYSQCRADALRSFLYEWQLPMTLDRDVSGTSICSFFTFNAVETILAEY